MVWIDDPENPDQKIEVCLICHAEVKVMVFRGRGVCSTNCEKLAHGQPLTEEKAVSP